MPGIRGYEDGLLAIGYSRGQSKTIARQMVRRDDFREVHDLFTGDPTALVAALRALGYDVPARYTRPSQPTLETS